MQRKNALKWHRSRGNNLPYLIEFTKLLEAIVKKKILVTGAGGFIGKNLVEQLADDYDIYAPRIDELNLCDTDKVDKYLEDHKVAIVIHTANFGARDSKKAAPHEVMEFGLRMFFNLERCSHMYERMYYFGSGAEYDSQNYIPFMTEEYFGKNIPVDAYGFYKYILSKQCEKNDNIVDLRLFGIYGKYEQWMYRFISSNICRVLKGMPMTLSQNMYFDYIYMDDLVNIMRYFIENKPLYKHYNVCRGTHIDLVSLGEMIRNVMKSDCEFYIASEGYKKEYSGDNSRLLREIGQYRFKPFEETIEYMSNYYKGILDEIDENILP